jgi:hypothetical protein
VVVGGLLEVRGDASELCEAVDALFDPIAYRGALFVEWPTSARISRVGDSDAHTASPQPGADRLVARGVVGSNALGMVAGTTGPSTFDRSLVHERFTHQAFMPITGLEHKTQQRAVVFGNGTLRLVLTPS